MMKNPPANRMLETVHIAVSAPAKGLPGERTGIGYNYLIAGQKAKIWL
jgi:hypothetical protein